MQGENVGKLPCPGWLWHGCLSLDLPLLLLLLLLINKKQSERETGEAAVGGQGTRLVVK